MGEVHQIRQEESWLKAKEVAEHTGCSSAHLRSLVRQGKVPARNIGMGRRPFYVFKISEVDAALDRLKAVAS